MSDPSFADREATVRRLVAEIDAELAAEAKTEEAADEKRAAAARRGDQGVEWQRVQQRIDLGQTSLADVFSGADESTDAATLRRRSSRNFSELGAKLAEDAADDPSAFDPSAEAAEILAELQQRIREVQQRLGTTGGAQ